MNTTFGRVIPAGKLPARRAGIGIGTSAPASPIPDSGCAASGMTEACGERPMHRRIREDVR